MATLTERTNELSVSVGQLDERLTNLRIVTTDLYRRVSSLELTVGEFRTDVALLRQAIDELKKANELWSSRWWTVVTLIIGSLLACVSSLLVALWRK